MWAFSQKCSLWADGKRELMAGVSSPHFQSSLQKLQKFKIFLRSSLPAPTPTLPGRNEESQWIKATPVSTRWSGTWLYLVILSAVLLVLSNYFIRWAHAETFRGPSAEFLSFNTSSSRRSFSALPTFTQSSIHLVFCSAIGLKWVHFFSKILTRGISCSWFSLTSSRGPEE